jgi:myosin heavy subunit
MSGAPAEEIRELRETSRTLQQKLDRTKRQGLWRISLGLLLLLGVLLGAVMVVQSVDANDAAMMRRQQLQLAAEQVAATGSKLANALTMMSHHGHAARSEQLSELPFRPARSEQLSELPFRSSYHSDGDLKTDIAAEELGQDKVELKWVKKEFKELKETSKLKESTLKAQKRQAAESLAIQQATAKAQHKDLTVVTDELTQLRQEVKDSNDSLASARARISKSEEALLGKEIEIAELKNRLAKHTQLAAKKEALEKAQCDCKKSGNVYADAMSCEKDLNKATQALNKVKDTLHHTQTELNLKKSDFRKFLGMLQGTWSETKTLKSQIDALQADHDFSSDGGAVLSTKDKVLQLLGIVHGAHASSSSIPDVKSSDSHANW